MNHGPLVTFVVPCFKLAHLLGECLTSILRQSYANLEVLVMDDCSPDDVAGVVAACADRRVQHVRNVPNRGHLRNYNQGIALAKGEYVWLISADDVLRDRSVVERLVGVLEQHPRVGYAFCPAVRFTAAGDRGIYGSHGEIDRIFGGSDFLCEWLTRGNSVPAAAGLVRRACYERAGGFPLDMPFAGDWYMWSAFALYFDVAYLAAPMVGYRAHDANMTLDFKARPLALVADMFRVLWRMKALAAQEGRATVVNSYRDAITAEYAYRMTQANPSTGDFRLSLAEFLGSLAEHTKDRRERAQVRSAVYAAVGDHQYMAADWSGAREWYEASLREQPLGARTYAKKALMGLGPIGRRIRAGVMTARDARARRDPERTPEPASGKACLAPNVHA